MMKARNKPGLDGFATECPRQLKGHAHELPELLTVTILNQCLLMRNATSLMCLEQNDVILYTYLCQIPR